MPFSCAVGVAPLVDVVGSLCQPGMPPPVGFKAPAADDMSVTLQYSGSHSVCDTEAGLCIRQQLGNNMFHQAGCGNRMTPATASQNKMVSKDCRKKHTVHMTLMQVRSVKHADGSSSRMHRSEALTVLHQFVTVNISAAQGSVHCTQQTGDPQQLPIRSLE